MALFQAVGDQADRAVFDVVMVEAGNAAEMEAKLVSALQAAGRPDLLADIDLGGGGAGPRWQAIATMADTVTTGQVADPTQVIVAAGVGGNPAEAIAKAKARLAEQAVPGTIVKATVAGAGVGPTFMALIVGDL